MSAFARAEPYLAEDKAADKGRSFSSSLSPSSRSTGANCSSSSSSSGGIGEGTFYAATSEQSCTGKKKCVAHSWGIALQNKTGYAWEQIEGGSGGEANIYIKAASPGGIRSMSVWVNDVIIDVITVSKKISRRPHGSEFGPYVAYLNAGPNNKVELRDTESSPGLDVIGVRVIAQVAEPDSDNDGVPDSSDQCPFTPIGIEVDSGGCEHLDSDNDGLSDDIELALGTDPFNSDTDWDGLSDGQEVKDTNTNPLLRDTDGGGAGDADEIFRGFNPHDPTDDALFDYDYDGLTDQEEYELGTDPFFHDSDFDGLSDGDEVKIHNTNPLSYDSDSDGLSDGDEYLIYYTNPLSNDTDAGGASDGPEIWQGLNPLDPNDDQFIDLDLDGLSDGEELSIGTDRFNSDSDFDGILDGDEVKIHNTNPLLRDTDGGGLDDGNEILRGLNPLDPVDDG